MGNGGGFDFNNGGGQQNQTYDYGQFASTGFDAGQAAYN